MKTIAYPEASEWPAIARRPAKSAAELDDTVRLIFEDIRQHGDTAVKKYTARFDQVELDKLAVGEDEWRQSAAQVAPELRDAIALAMRNIEAFHAAQKETPQVIATMPGVQCRRESRPIERVGIYVPGGSAPLFSTVLMLGIPARLAGCKEIVLCSPPGPDERIHPAILYAASAVGVTAVFRAGGIQAVAAMTLGTESIPQVDKIFGPGNQYVTAAKQYAQRFGVAIDMPAGPSEVLVIAGAGADPDFVAADLLSQAEHGPDSQVILLSDNAALIEQTLVALRAQLEALPRRDIARQALEHSRAVLLPDLEACIEFSNRYAPEHLIIAADDAERFVPGILNAGSVFLGHYSCESVGDYASGTNHTLPTAGYARNYSGVSLDSFVKKITFQSISREGIGRIGPAIEIMAEAEGLWAHKNAVTLRLQK
ncbi:MAG: histidinol dehydrogenase [Saprospiraceae bacterium]|nr:histidinol dehydrogenase [Saprospiraceae bacterium]